MKPMKLDAPHGWRDGIKRALTIHLPLFGAPSVLAVYLIPGPFKWIVAGAMAAQAVRGELDDVKNGEDTPAKAIIDAVSQAGPAIVAAALMTVL